MTHNDLDNRLEETQERAMAGTRRTLSPLPKNYRLMLVKTYREIVVGGFGMRFDRSL
jgi:hypothetical protein